MKTERGQWYEKNGERWFVCGFDSIGDPVLEDINGEFVSPLLVDCNEENGWKHLPDCDSFDWGAETYPKYWTTVGGPGSRIGSRIAYIEQLSKTDWRYCYKDGSVDGSVGVGGVMGDFCADGRTQLTKEQAEALVTPLESPDDWVTQDRVPARDGIDQRRYVFDGVPAKWDDAENIGWPDRSAAVHGARAGGTNTIIELRCRRKDLPTVAPKKTRLKLWAYRDVVKSITRVCAGPASRSPSDMTWEERLEVHQDDEGFYVEE